MPRYRLTLEYDGSGFHGWQRQRHGPSVQALLEEALRRFCGEMASVLAAGRTDSGAHALGQVVHVDLAGDWPARTVRGAVNSHLRPAPVVVLEAARVRDDFHARFSATGRTYLYRILDRGSPPCLERGRVWHRARGLHTGAMAEAARQLVGRHDFSTFRDAQCQAASPVKTLDALAVWRRGDLVLVRARARSFLHRQVRGMVGSLAHVGEGRWSAAELRAALEARDRRACGIVAPACGLYLESVAYPREAWETAGPAGPD